MLEDMYSEATPEQPPSSDGSLEQLAKPKCSDATVILPRVLQLDMAPAKLPLPNKMGTRHTKDTERLINVLNALRDLGNTVIVVEHDEAIMAAADYVIDIGPEAGSFGGEVMASGSYKSLLKSNTLTAQYLNTSMPKCLNT